jgi:transcriptional regulator with XRE-family HTH domain
MMKERLKELRTALNLTQQEFADRIGIQRGTYAKYEVGRNDPIDAVIRLICQTFNVNEEWLRTGAGQMFVDVSRADELARLIEETMSEESGEIKRRIATAVLRLTPDQLRACTDWNKETFGLVEAPAAERELTIDEKVENYRRELEAEEAIRTLEASPTGSAGGAKEA